MASVLLVCGFLALLFLIPLRTGVKIGADEDWELSKATLSVNGYKFYTEVWNDQPLLHTAIITQILKYVSYSVLGPRLVTSGFAILLLLGVFVIGNRIGGLVVATVATGLLIASPGFLELSSSCMVEIPALAPAVAGLAWLISTYKGSTPLPGPLPDRGGEGISAGRIPNAEAPNDESTPLPGPLRDRGGEGFSKRSSTELSAAAHQGSRESSAIAVRTVPSPSPQPSPLGRGRQWIAVVIAGILFGISFQIKFINVVLLPVVPLIIWLRERPSGETSNRIKGAAKSMLLFIASVVITFVAIALMLGPESYWIQMKQSWAAHFASTRSYEHGSPADHPFEWSVYLKNWDTVVPAIIGIAVCIWRASPHPAPDRKGLLSPALSSFGGGEGVLLVIPLAWFALELVVFGIHKPWWSYYYVHNSVPLCLCAAIGIAAVVQVALGRAGSFGEAIGKRQRTAAVQKLAQHLGNPSPVRRGRRDVSMNSRTKGLLSPTLSSRWGRRGSVAVVGICGLAMAGWMGSRVYLQIGSIRSSPQIYSSLVIKEVERYKPFTKFIYTDEPAYSFHTGIPMPPSLAVVTLKRFWSGDMTNARLVEELRMSKPGVLLLKNQTAELPFSDWMNAEYRLVYQDAKHNLYAHKSIVGKVKW